MSDDATSSWIHRRLAGAGAGAVAAVALVDLELFTRYLPALRGTDLPAQGSLALAATLMAVPAAALAGAVHRGVAYASLVAAAAWGSPTPLIAAGLAVVAAVVAELLRRWPLAGAGLLLPLLFVALDSGPPSPASGPAGGPPDIVLVVLDTVPAAATSLHGSPLETTPILQQLAQQATVYTQATSPAPWTVPSHASMLTGRMPREAGCHHEHPALPPSVPTTAEALAAHGYRTGAFLANPWIGRFNGITRGFEHQESQWEHSRAVRSFSLLGLIPAAPSKGASGMRQAALRWLDEGPDQPAFVLLNLLEAHSPFQDTPDATRFGVEDPEGVGNRTHLVQEAGLAAVPDYPRPGELDAARRLQAAGIHHVDEQVGELIAAIKERGRWHRTALIVTSDHGEAFGEHGFHGHMVGLHQETLHVPLVVRAPGQAPGVVTAPVSTTALHATMLDLAGLSAADAVPPLPHHDAEANGEPILSEQLRPLQLLSDMRRATGQQGAVDIGELDHRAARARDNRWAILARQPSDGSATRWSLYDLAADPVEAHDRWADRPQLSPDEAAAVQRLEDAVQARLRAPVGSGDDLRMDSDLRAELEALGYLGGD